MTQLDDDVMAVRAKIYELENVRIQAKQFLDNNNQPIFINNVEIENQSQLPMQRVVTALRHLQTTGQDEFIIFPHSSLDDPNIEFVVRSRIYHIIWCIYRTENRPAMERNVGDYKYIRHVKRSPLLNNPLIDVINDTDVQSIFRVGGQLINAVIMHLQGTTKYQHISNFQKDCGISTLKNLSNRKNSNGLVFVAGTGSGKSFAYQLPFLLWILNKKIKEYDEYINTANKKNSLLVNCSLLLVFPRTSLANDQYESLIELIDVINEFVDNNINDTNRCDFYKIKKPIRDYDGKAGSLTEAYSSEPDIIITTPQSLENRLANPECYPVFRNGIDSILYDEVHLWKGIPGAEIASLNARLRNLFTVRGEPPLFIGMSATIDNPEIHCQKLFALIKNSQKPDKITQNDIDDMEDHTIEHHLMLKPAAGRYLNGVAMESTSCLIHNRRNGLDQYHDDIRGGAGVNTRDKPKSITFLDSLNGTGGYTRKLNDYEDYFGQRKFTGQYLASTRPERKYMFYNKPKQGQSFRTGTGNGHYTEDCTNCQNRTNFDDMLDCEYYRRGECWHYSLDDANQFNTLRWQPVFHPTRETWIPVDSIRSKRVSSIEKNEAPSNDINEYFLHNQAIPTFNPLTRRTDYPSINNVQIDNVVATSTLEVGVDFSNIQEIIQIGPINSPSSYKQKAGRGAREGNLENGLFIMSIIDESPVSYYHFKHFGRLIKSTLDPLSLEITNPNVVIGHCFLSIFDWFAYNDINLFRIRTSANNYLSEMEIDDAYTRAITLLNDARTKKYLAKFLDTMGTGNIDVDNIIRDALDFVTTLSTKHSITVNQGQGNERTDNYTLHEWLIRASDYENTYKEIMDPNTGLRLTAAPVRQDERNAIFKAISELKQEYNRLFPNEKTLDNELINLRRELFD